MKRHSRRAGLWPGRCADAFQGSSRFYWGNRSGGLCGEEADFHAGVIIKSQQSDALIAGPGPQFSLDRYLLPIEFLVERQATIDVRLLHPERDICEVSHKRINLCT